MPDLSLVVAGSRPNGPPAQLFDALAPALAHGTVEVIVASARPEGGPSPRQGVRIVRAPCRTTVPRLRALGLAAAKAPIVALTEDFCVPAPGWAEAILGAHRRLEAIAIGGPIDRQDGGAADWALSLFEYGRFFRREPEGPVPDLPGTNVSYKACRLREALGAPPEEFLEVRVHAALRTRGETFWRLPEAVMIDRNERPLLSAVASQYHHGRLFGFLRAEGSGIGHRLLRVAAAPLVPAVLIARIAPAAAAAGRTSALLRSAPILLLLSLSWALGEGVGSLFGAGGSRLRWQ